MKENINDTQLSPLELVKCCPLCSSEKQILLCQLPDILYGEDPNPIFTYSKCVNCQVIYLSTRPFERDIGSYYPSNYAPYAKSSQKENKTLFDYLISRLNKVTTKPLSKMANYNYSRMLKKVYEPREKGRFLDYGCGSSNFLDNARKKGWETCGADFTQYPIEEVKKAGHQCFLINEKLDQVMVDESFDLIRVNHVFEHLYIPQKTAALTFKKLKPSGVLHLSMPNPEGISIKFLGKYALALEAPRHLILYPPKTIVKLLKDAGFSDVKVVGEFITKDFSRSVDIRKRSVKKEKLPIFEVLAAHESVFKDFLYSPFIFISRIMNRPDRYHIVAKKS